MTWTDDQIRARVSGILDQVIGETIPNKETLSDKEKLGIILSESLQSLIYVTTIEDEFDIRIEDDQIDLDLFENVDVTVGRISYLLSVREA